MKPKIALLAVISAVAGYCVLTGTAAHADPGQCPVIQEQELLPPADPLHLLDPYEPVVDFAHDRRAIS